jgi:eukaryotic-like serine/threonine-protein kinase
MALPVGTKLGRYEIQSPLGAGGMGEVYLARDLRLGRDVAIKILLDRLSSNADAIQRFELEAKAISALNDSNICTLYDVGHQDGVDFIVMEYLEGETLQDRLRKGPLPMDQVFKYGAQIASGLDKAHRKAILHRDLKPANIMLTRSGAKLLDFGLAQSSLPMAAETTVTAADCHCQRRNKKPSLAHFPICRPSETILIPVRRSPYFAPACEPRLPAQSWQCTT